jgi:hypothetical protein
MPFNKRTKSTLPGPGPYLAEVVNHLDTTYMGGLEVVLITHIPGFVNNPANSIPVKYMSPFYGVTSPRFLGNNSADFNDTQKSYGMWMIPPDIGSTVMVMFVNSDPNQGYWIGCVPGQDIFINNMVPGIAATNNVELTPAQRSYYGNDVTSLPAAEFNKKVYSGKNPNVDSVGRPVHPFAERLLKQGLLLDTVRGVTSSSARREVPSQVYGISTPGPLDTSVNAKRADISFGKGKMAPVSRLGGSTFVMDDGDINGNNELVRIRTRTGHQILLHNSQDLIYIGNSAGSAWIEMTSAGKLDIFANDSVSIHSAGDFNFRADRDVNIEAVRNININALGGASGANSGGNITVSAQNSSNLLANNMYIQTVGGYNLSVSNDLNVSVSGAMNQTASGKLSLKSNDVLSLGASSDVSVVGGTSITMTAAVINQNGPTATPPTKATPTVPKGLNLFSVSQNSTGTSWSGNHYSAAPVVSIMQRIPSHEPWEGHENLNPALFSFGNTDSNIEATYTTSNGVIIQAPPSASKPVPFKAGPGKDRGTVNGVPTPWTTDDAFLNKVKEVAALLTFEPIDLLAVMNSESARTFDPAITNSLGYTGLIQFGNDAARSLGTTTSYLRGLTRVQQMDYVYQYFHKLWGWPTVKCPEPTLGNIYTTVFLPAFRFYLPDQVICAANDPKTSAYYLHNPVFDPNKLGYITMQMMTDFAGNMKAEVIKCLDVAGKNPDFSPKSSS